MHLEMMQPIRIVLCHNILLLFLVLSTSNDSLLTNHAESDTVKLSFNKVVLEDKKLNQKLWQSEISFC